MNPSRLIPNDLHGRNTLIGGLPIVGDFVGDASPKDVLFAVIIPTFIVMNLIEMLPPSISQYGAFIILGVIGIGFSLIAAIPDYTTLSGLINQFRTFHGKANESRRGGTKNDDKIEHRTWETTESTVDKTHIKKLYGNKGVIERDDDVICGAIKINGINLDTATEQSVAQATEGFANFLNSNLDFPIQIYMTTRKFNPEKFLEKYEDRLEDPEIQDNAPMQMYIQNYMQRTPQFLSQHYYREYYIIVPVSRWDVRQSSREEGALDLSVVPGIGDILAEVFGKSDVSQITEDQIKQRQIDECWKRMQKIKQNGLDNIGADATIIDDVNHFAALIKEFWEGRDMAYKRDKEFVRSDPIVHGETDLQASELQGNEQQRLAEELKKNQNDDAENNGDNQ